MLKFCLFPLLLVFFLVGAGCDSGDGPSDPPVPAEVPGLVLAQSDTDVVGTLVRFNQQLQANQQFSVVANVNHSGNAQSVGLTLRPTRLLLAINPQLNTPILQANQVASIDLPQRLLVFEQADGTVLAAYDDPSYIAARHGVGSVTTLGPIRAALRQFTEAGTGSTVSEPGAGTVSRDQGLVSVQSNADVLTTYGRLRAAVEANADLSIVAEINHDENAANIGVDLRPTRVLIFGNPALGTPLMQSAQTIGIDLPQKMLVYTNATGATFVVYNDPAFLAARHGATGVDEQIGAIRTALQGLAATAAGN